MRQKNCEEMGRNANRAAQPQPECKVSCGHSTESNARVPLLRAGYARQWAMQTLRSAAKMIKKGSLFIITSGEYSDYELVTICKALCDIDVQGAKAEYLQAYPEQGEDYKFRYGKFVTWLINEKRIAKELDYFEWHTDDYGIVDFSVTKGSEE
jgi:hypothetical protein